MRASPRLCQSAKSIALLGCALLAVTPVAAQKAGGTLRLDVACAERAVDGIHRCASGST